MSTAGDSSGKAVGGVLERLEGLICLEALRQVLRGFGVQIGVTEAASKEVRKRRALSAAADSKEGSQGGVLERG